MKKFIERTIFKVILVTIFSLAACVTSPTGRKQFIVVSDGEMGSVGGQAFDEMKKKTPIEYNSRINAYVKCIANAITQEAHDKTGVQNWEVVVFKDSSANAFALPGGKIGVHTGMLSVAKNADQLAAVLGHEVGHVIARHGAERVSQSTITQTGMAVADAMLDQQNENRGLILAGLGVGAQFGVLLPFSRKHESEADEIGLNLMAQAGFVPEQSVELWRNMAKAGGGAPPEFMSTHPSNASRISGLQSNMAKARRIYNNAIQSGKSPDCGSL
ncbi:MAG: M48 family metallopeptidase [Bdellovibrionales bacterium]|nr:M48 family metallopeptidase [Bdellovibrionales bacterium]